MARYGRDYGRPWGGGSGMRRGYGGDYATGDWGRRGYDPGYEGGGWGMEGLYDTIVGGRGERGGGRYDAGFHGRSRGQERGRSPFGSQNWGQGGGGLFGRGRGYGGDFRGYDRSFGQRRVSRQRYDSGWW